MVDMFVEEVKHEVINLCFSFIIRSFTLHHLFDEGGQEPHLLARVVADTRGSFLSSALLAHTSSKEKAWREECRGCTLIVRVSHPFYREANSFMV